MTRDPPLITGDALALHPIDVCHRSLLHGTLPPPPPSTGRKRQREDEFVPSATELEQVGVHFSRSPTRSLRDISFWPDDDVRLLSDGVVSNRLGSDKAVARMFNRLAKNAVLDRRSPLRGVQGQVNDHRENAWNEWWATAGAEGGAATGRGKLLSSSRSAPRAPPFMAATSPPPAGRSVPLLRPRCTAGPLLHGRRPAAPPTSCGPQHAAAPATDPPLPASLRLSPPPSALPLLQPPPTPLRRLEREMRVVRMTCGPHHFLLFL
ncbi:uncharacterized protein [Oryza sativa Japonica Group]|uniref:uncharacterized protein n=1 Tax=Oryza sativa subsp. japonica TaxID=39947 RepID=UPI000775492A|nr:CASP-like protein 4A1 [Oryza sativa Japonica Group]